MLHSIGSMKNLPANINLNSIPDYFKNNSFTTSVGFRCFYPSLVNNYPVEKKGLLYIDKINNLLKMYYFTKDATFISSGIYIGNTVRKIDWFQIVDGRHSSIFDDTYSSKKLVTNKDIQIIVDRFITKYDDTQLWKELESKFHKDLWNQYTNKQDPYLRRGGEVFVNTNGGVIVINNNIHGSKRGIRLRRPESGASMNVYSDGAYHIIGNLVQGNTHIHSDRKLFLQSRNRPIVQSGDAGGGNREIVIRADIRWKQMYNGRQGLKSIAYPGHAREVIVQLYNDVGGRVNRVTHPEPMRHFVWRDRPKNRHVIAYELDVTGGKATNEQTDYFGRVRDYKEYAPMHFVKGIYNRINQDTAFVNHHGNCIITLDNAGRGFIEQERIPSAYPYWWMSITNRIAIVDTRYGRETDRSSEIRPNQGYHTGPREVEGRLASNPYTGLPWTHVDIEGMSGRIYELDQIWSYNVWRNKLNMTTIGNDYPSIRRVWWR